MTPSTVQLGWLSGGREPGRRGLASSYAPDALAASA